VTALSHCATRVAQCVCPLSVVRLLILACSFVASSVSAQLVMPLYEGAIPNSIEAPDEEAIRDPSEPYPFHLNISRPTLTVYLPSAADANRAVVVILPGGSYRGVSLVKEGHDVALEFNRMGVAAVVLKCRTPNPRHMSNQAQAPLQDVQQALRVVRSQASEWHIDTQRVGLMGFSAGGHLAALAATRFDHPVLADANAPHVRPDFLMLVYPVASFLNPLAHAISRQQLLGDSPSEAALREYSVDLAVTPNTPPTFLVHAADDKAVKVESTLRFFDALRANSVLAELHIYPRGGHGFGLNNATTHDRWIDRCRNWLLSQGILAPVKEPR